MRRPIVARAPQSGNFANDTLDASIAARRIRKHLTATLASKSVALLTARAIAAWRDNPLAAGIKPATAVRLCKAVKAAPNLAARHDRRIRNRQEWRDVLGGISEDFESCNVQRLNDDQVRGSAMWLRSFSAIAA
jgi:hypothetical protein